MLVAISSSKANVRRSERAPRPKSSVRRVKLFLLLSTLVALFLPGCGQKDRRKRPKELTVLVPPRSEDRPETDAKRVVVELRASLHKKLDCSDCHAPATEPAPKELGKPSCTSGCHEKEDRAYRATVHATTHGKDGEVAARCEDCHGSHDVKSPSDPESRVFARKLPFTCGKCHANAELARSLGIKDPLAGGRYFESIHGRGLVTAGLLVAPSCADCHGKAHTIREASDPRSTVNAANVATTCGQCHAGEKEAYQSSVHARALANPKAKPPSHAGSAAARKPELSPICSTCHTAHSIVAPGGAFRLASDRICGDCHEDRLARYLETYHGRAHSLGDEFVAACSDCHGSHAILPVADPKSTLSDRNRLNTCRQCHAGAPQNFANYMAHADHTDRKNYPGLYWAFVAMTGLVVGTFGFFGVHSLLWLGRALIVRARDPVAFREHKRRMRREQGARLYRRFGPVDRFCHFLVIVSFLLLVITGMPLKFHEHPWARIFFDAIGGPSVASSVHRFGALITLSYFVIHILSLLYRVRSRRDAYVDEKGRVRVKRLLAFVFGPDSPLPRLQDAKDLGRHMKWFFGRGPKPKFDRFTYWEKFDYMAVFWGVTVIGLSGLVLWFPAFFTRFFPGWSINFAHIIHSDEALLAAGFIFVFHFFNSHFRPDKFPLDPVMFSGRLTEAEMRHEHPAQYDRLVAEGRLEELAFGDEWQEWKWVLNTFGVAAIVLGVSLAGIIFWALLG